MDACLQSLGSTGLLGLEMRFFLSVLLLSTGFSRRGFTSRNACLTLVLPSFATSVTSTGASACTASRIPRVQNASKLTTCASTTPASSFVGPRGNGAALELAANPVDTGEIAQLEAKVADNGDDHQARIDLAVALNAADRREEALDQLIESIRRDREWNEEAARKQLLQMFEAWGFGDPMSVAGRRRLSSILFS